MSMFVEFFKLMLYFDERGDIEIPADIKEQITEEILYDEVIENE